MPSRMCEKIMHSWGCPQIANIFITNHHKNFGQTGDEIVVFQVAETFNAKYICLRKTMICEPCGKGEI